jgi:hypothetical protein
MEDLKDFCGRDVSIGDIVSFIRNSNGRMGLQIGRIIGYITDGKIVIDYVTEKKNRREIIHPGKTLKVTGSKLTHYLLKEPPKQREN